MSPSASDEEVLAQVMRRVLEDTNSHFEAPVYVDVEPGFRSMCLDGWVALEPGEAEILHRILRTARDA